MKSARTVYLKARKAETDTVDEEKEVMVHPVP